MSAAPQSLSTGGSRSRPQARRKQNDDASYNGPINGASGSKRQATDKAEGEPRMKRKRVDAPQISTNNSGSGRRDADESQRISLVEFVKMPTTVLHKYLTQYDVVPMIYPSPLTADDPPPPSTLADPFRVPPSPPLLTPANRPRRDLGSQSRRRSSRLLEDDIRGRPPILADVDQLHVVLAGLVERHFHEMSAITPREEVDTLASFMCAVGKTKGKAYYAF
ncbi:hypothetical protein BDN72DRAFT_852004 [Pluteus cervinus]|uniref:Uncharacterized protein n=1 Tax=Pluteus cervinus TaxID=181527 RepID=A0ACD3BGA2_9AGAR|nr:hypothetical protein BDN72DRAFT_852004 [Pluteus cervinus]